MEKTICELFAGVGGFRLGFDRLNTGWQTKWFSQWEPGASKQWAHDCYVQHFGECADLNGEFHTGDDISTVNKDSIPSHTLLVGGFPCQDYSVAHTLASSKGIEGKKGVLWWQIRDILIAKNATFCIFENVDRLLKSPASQRGRDFGIILSCLNDLGYSVEWRVVNAAIYGAAQRRRRTFIFAYKDTSAYAKACWEDTRSKIFNRTLVDVIQRDGNGLTKHNKNGEISSAPNFMKAAQNTVFIRGSGEDSSLRNKTECVNGIRMIPQCIWLKGKAIPECSRMHCSCARWETPSCIWS